MNKYKITLDTGKHEYVAGDAIKMEAWNGGAFCTITVTKGEEVVAEYKVTKLGGYKVATEMETSAFLL